MLAGIGQAGPLTLLPACIQYTSPHAYLSTATGLAFSSRAIGGAFGSAVLNAIINNHIDANYAPAVSSAAVAAGLPESSVKALLGALAQGETTGVPGATPAVWAAALDASHWQYAYAYRLAWSSIIPFVALALIAIFFMRRRQGAHDGESGGDGGALGACTRRGDGSTRGARTRREDRSSGTRRGDNCLLP